MAGAYHPEELFFKAAISRSPSSYSHLFLICRATMIDFLKLLILTAVPTTQNQKALSVEILAPKMNAVCERVIGTLRRECLNHCIILNEKHLHRILTEYINEYYNKTRTHQSLSNDCPEPRAIDPPENGTVISTPILGGLHHRYTRKAVG
jgi:hypothetical protein